VVRHPLHDTAGVVAVALATVVLAAACSSGTSGSTTPTAAPSTAARVSAMTGSTASSSPTTQKVAAASNAFLATLDAGQKDTVLFDWTDTAQKQKWSNFPTGPFQRAGLKWGDLSQPQQAAWLAIMRASLSTEGYDRVVAEWAADDANAALTGQSNLFGKQYYYLALIGNPSDTGPFMWQFGGHHVTVNATVAGGRISVTPSFIGDQPSSYTDATGKTVVPLGDIQDESFALVNSLTGAQKQAAVLGTTPIDLVLGPGEDGKTIAPEGVQLSTLTPDQQAAAMKLIGHYTGLVDDADAAARRDEVRSGLNQTYFAWYGPTTPGSAAYFRFTGPTLVIEYAPQGDPQGDKTPTTAHIHGIYRDPTNEYGAKYAS
jgi:Protein of unknown function (DUF3500)